MKSPLLIISKTMWSQHMKRILWSTVGYGGILSLLSLVKFQNQQNMLDSFASLFLILLTWVSLIMIIGFTQIHFGLKQTYFPIQLFNYPIPSWKIGSLFYWGALVVVLVPVLLLGGYTRLLGASILDMNGFILAVCFITIGLTFALRMPFILLALAGMGAFCFWNYYLVPSIVDPYLPFYRGLVMIGFLFWGNILFVGSASYQRHHGNFLEWMRQVVLPAQSRSLKAVPSIYPRMPKDSPKKSLMWMEAVRFSQNLWVMAGLLAVTPFVIFLFRKPQWTDFYTAWMGCIILVILLKKSGHGQDARRAQQAARLYLPFTDFELGQAEYRGFYLSLGLQCTIGLYIIGILSHFDILKPTYYDNIQGPQKTVFLMSIPLIVIASLSVIAILSLLNEMAKQYQKPFNKIVVGIVLFLMLFPMGFVIPNIHALFSNIKRPDTVTELLGGALWGLNLLVIVLVMGVYLWSLRESYQLTIISRTLLLKSIGIFTTGLLIGLVFFGLINGISYLLVSNLLVGLSIVLLPMQLLPLIVHKQRHQ